MVVIVRLHKEESNVTDICLYLGQMMNCFRSPKLNETEINIKKAESLSSAFQITCDEEAVFFFFQSFGHKYICKI